MMDWTLAFWSFLLGFTVYDLLLGRDGFWWRVGRRIVEMGGSSGGRRGLRRAARTTTQPNAPGEEEGVTVVMVRHGHKTSIRPPGGYSILTSSSEDESCEGSESDGDPHFHEDSRWSEQDNDGTLRAGLTGHDSRGRPVDFEFVGSPAAAWDHFKPWESLEGLRAYAAFRFGPDWERMALDRGSESSSDPDLERG